MECAVERVRDAPKKLGCADDCLQGVKKKIRARSERIGVTDKIVGVADRKVEEMEKSR
jgi:hypothetical protein